VEHRIIRADGLERILLEQAVINYNDYGKPYRLVGAVQDITEFIRGGEEREKLIKETEQQRDKLKTILNSVPDEIWVFDSLGKPMQINEAVTKSLGIKPQDDIYLDKVLSLLEARNPDGDKMTIEETALMRSLSGEVISGDEMVRHPVTGEWRHRHFHSAPITDKKGSITGVVAVVNDITEGKLAEEKILASLKEKEILLRELYHRTKNNMQVVSSLLGLKAEAVGDEKVKNIIEEMKHRIQVMSLVHEKLYQSQNLSRVDLKEYISDLVNLILKSYSIPTGKLTVNMNLENIDVVLDTAIPCGLIVNELLSNSIKYAFPAGRAGNIYIALKTIADDVIQLKVEDDGIGIKESDMQHQNKIGLQLFRIIAEDQLQGEVKFENVTGVSWTISFKDTLYNERV